MIISELLDSGSQILKTHRIKTCQLDSEIILSNLLKKQREKLITNSEEKVSRSIIDNFNRLITRRSKREPLAYILKKKNFGLKFFLLTGIRLYPDLKQNYCVKV